jgi:hypothetical protein
MLSAPQQPSVVTRLIGDSRAASGSPACRAQVHVLRAIPEILRLCHIDHGCTTSTLTTRLQTMSFDTEQSRMLGALNDEGE